MLRTREQKRILELKPSELRVLRYAMIRFRNKVLGEGKPTEDIDRLLLKLI